MKCYSSKDLYNWKDEGIIIPPEPDDQDSSLHPTKHMDRPHIIYNKKTGKYVCWLKVIQKDDRQTEAVLTADWILGPYTKIRDDLQPLGMSAGDYDLAVDDNGKAYYYFEKVHSEIICAELNEEYTGVTGVYSSHFPQPCPPFVREAPAHFIRNGKHYLVTSGTTGYFPNPSEVAVADDWHGPFTVLGNPHPEDASQTSYHSQISCVFKVEGKKDLYIACADRWLPNAMHLEYAMIENLYIKRYRDNVIVHYPELDDVRKNIAAATYVWLPFRFDGEMAYLDWKDEWRIEDYE